MYWQTIKNSNKLAVFENTDGPDVLLCFERGEGDVLTSIGVTYLEVLDTFPTHSSRIRQATDGSPVSLQQVRISPHCVTFSFASGYAWMLLYALPEAA